MNRSHSFRASSAFRTANPALNDRIFSQAPATSSAHMTVSGTVNKTFILLIALLVTASFAWQQAYPRVDPMGNHLVPTPFGLLLIGGIGGFIVAMITVFKKQWAPITAPIYALLEGLFLGALSAVFEYQYPGIVVQAVLGTFGTLFALLALYKARIVRATENFKLGVFAATGAIGFIYLFTIILGFFGVSIPYIHDSGPIGIGFSVVVVVIAALNLVMDFDFIENGERMRSAKYMEWYAAFGLMVTLIWLYIEILRLLSKLRDRR